jgi:hypothetical protein
MLAESRCAGQPPVDHQEKPMQPACPVCTGPLLIWGPLWRCTRCCYTICEGCEGGPAVREGERLASGRR